jgi:superfamily II DNA/RNA helicase
VPWRDALVAAVRGGGGAACQAAGESGSGGGRTLVLVRDPPSAARAAAALREAGLDGVATYTAADPPAARAATLAALAAATGRGDGAAADATAAAPAPCILVATDAAARGLDVPRLAHVVQAHFAANAVDFLHRVGRTARAGGAGAVTSLVEPGSADLAAAVRGAVEAGAPLEGAFSRKRSFRRKLRRYGEFVPRGQRPLGAGAAKEE